MSSTIRFSTYFVLLLTITTQSLKSQIDDDAPNSMRRSSKRVSQILADQHSYFAGVDDHGLEEIAFSPNNRWLGISAAWELTNRRLHREIATLSRNQQEDSTVHARHLFYFFGFLQARIDVPLPKKAISFAKHVKMLESGLLDIDRNDLEITKSEKLRVESASRLFEINAKVAITNGSIVCRSKLTNKVLWSNQILNTCIADAGSEPVDYWADACVSNAHNVIYVMGANDYVFFMNIFDLNNGELVGFVYLDFWVTRNKK